MIFNYSYLRAQADFKNRILFIKIFVLNYHNILLIPFKMVYCTVHKSAINKHL